MASEDSNKDKTIQFPQPSKKMVTYTKWIGALLIALFLATQIANWLTDYIWADHLAYGDVFLTIFTTQIGLGLIGFILFFVSTFVMLFNIRSTFLREFPNDQLISIVNNRKPFMWVNAGISFLAGIFGYLIVKGIGWERMLTYLHQESFGVTDPYFGRDLSFFVYTLPMWNFVIGVLLFIIGANIAAKLILYSVRGLIQHSRRAQRHFLVSLILFGIVLAVKFLLDRYDTALTSKVNWFQDSVVFGVSFTDKFVNIPVDYIMAGATLLTALLLVLAIIRRESGFLGLAILLFGGVFLLGGAASLIVQSFIVSPNELAREESFLADNIEMTRSAYQLDTVNVEAKEVTPSLSRDMLDRNAATVDNIRVNDARPLKEVYNQLQTIRPYYQFLETDIDRYTIDGQYQQVFISSRELSQQNLPERAQTWVNQNLRYTHGYGAAVSHVNDITAEGQPEYIVKDLPPEGAITINRPQIYFGENNYNSVIVNSQVPEFDYPVSDDSADHIYETASGISMAGLNRALFAWDEKSYRYLISEQITNDSQILQTRNIYDRVERIAPFLDLDPDAYLVIRDDGTMVWMLDAFTMTDRYPFSDPGGYAFNYIRNSIKITVDAYTGEVTFYLVDADDPLAKTYQNMFPELFTTEVPEDIREHFRYPITLFNTQAELYRSYHMTNIEQFYNREDYWQFPTEKYYGEDIWMEPYYVTMKMEDTGEEEFILMIPFTPNTKHNMIAWMGVRNDGDHYGEMFIYTFTKQRNIYGPQQIENRINQNDTISQELNLWSQGGSRVIRGNLLVIPIEDTVLYVEPMYIESNNETALPEVKRIIVSYQDYIVMEPTLDRALERLLTLIEDGVTPEEATNEESDVGEETTPSSSTPDKLLEDLQTAFENYREANQDGRYAEAGQALQQIETLLEEWKTSQDNQNNNDAAPNVENEEQQPDTDSEE